MSRESRYFHNAWHLEAPSLQIGVAQPLFRAGEFSVEFDEPGCFRDYHPNDGLFQAVGSGAAGGSSLGLGSGEGVGSATLRAAGLDPELLVDVAAGSGAAPMGYAHATTLSWREVGLPTSVGD